MNLMKIKISLILIFLALNVNILFSQQSKSLSRIPTVAYMQNFLWHILDQNGKEMFKPLSLAYLTGYSEGFFSISKAIGKDTVWGFLDLQGKFAMVEGAKFVDFFRSGFALYTTWKSGVEDIKYFGYIRNDGVQITPPIYLEVTYFGEDGLAFVMNWEKRGYINQQGQFVKTFSQGFAEPYFEGLAVVQDSAGHFGYIDKNYKVVINMIYDETHNFSGSIARVNKNGYFGYIDKNGLEIVPPIYVDATDFVEGRAFVARSATLDSLKWAIFSPNGKQLTEFLYDGINDFSEGIAAVREKGNYYFVDIWGKRFLNENYENCNSFKNGLAWAVEKNGKKRSGYIDIQGNFQIIIPKDAQLVMDLRLNKVVK